LKTEQVGPDASGEPASAMSEDSLECWPSLIQSLKEKLDQLNQLKHQPESLSNQLRQKNTRIRELEKQSVRKSRECLVKDVRDIMSELTRAQLLPRMADRLCLHRRCVEYLATGNFYLLA